MKIQIDHMPTSQLSPSPKTTSLHKDPPVHSLSHPPPSPPHLLQHPPQKRPLQPPHLPPESLDLPPTIQRPPILHPQTPHHLLPRPPHPSIPHNLLPNPPPRQLLPQSLNLRLHSPPTQLPPPIPLRLRLMIRAPVAAALVRHMRLRGRVGGYGRGVVGGGEGG